MNEQCELCKYRKFCILEEPEEDWTCEHYAYYMDKDADDNF